LPDFLSGPPFVIGTIDYVVTEQVGNAATSTRTVIIEPAQTPTESSNSAILLLCRHAPGQIAAHGTHDD
jgi:hypothetical protein